jgi:hypothetical protein
MLCFDIRYVITYVSMLVHIMPGNKELHWAAGSLLLRSKQARGEVH